MRTIGLDLAVTGQHQALIADEQGNATGALLRLHTEPAALAALLDAAREGQPADTPVQVVMEPTSLSWLPVASFFIQRGVTVYLVNAQQVADLRKYYHKHAGSDRISARLLARLPWVAPEKLHPLQLPSAAALSGQRGCRQREELTRLSTEIQNRVQAWERAFWPGLEEVVGDLFSAWLRCWRETWYDPWLVQQADARTLETFLVDAGLEPTTAPAMVAGLQTVARQAVVLYGTPTGERSPYVDYAAVQAQVLRELRLLACCEAELQALRAPLRQLYQQVHPSRHLESLRGVGEDGAAVYAFFAGDIERFATQPAFRGWSGMVPASDQSGDVEKKGLHISTAGPDLIRKFAYLNADVARQWDPQLAALYYDQMVRKGKHHCQAVCACATHLLDRVRVVLREDRPYELRDVDGQVVTAPEARQIVLERYLVPEEVRRRSRHRTRKEQRDQRAEHKARRRSRSTR